MNLRSSRRQASVTGDREPPGLGDQLERWLTIEGHQTLGSLIEAFGDKSFAILLVILLGIPALPVPTGGATHVFEVIALLLALQLIAGRRDVWLPQRWRRLQLGGPRRRRFVTALLRLIRRLERISRPRLRFLFRGRVSDVVFGLLVIGGTVGAFLAPPFSGLDTLPALGVVGLSLGVLLEDVLVAGAGIVVGLIGVALEAVLGAAAVQVLGSLV